MKIKILSASLASIVFIGAIYGYLEYSKPTFNEIIDEINNKGKSLSELTRTEENIIFSKLHRNIKICYDKMKEIYSGPPLEITFSSDDNSIDFYSVENVGISGFCAQKAYMVKIMDKDFVSRAPDLTSLTDGVKRYELIKTSFSYELGEHPNNPFIIDGYLEDLDEVYNKRGDVKIFLVKDPDEYSVRFKIIGPHYNPQNGYYTKKIDIDYKGGEHYDDLWQLYNDVLWDNIKFERISLKEALEFNMPNNFKENLEIISNFFGKYDIPSFITKDYGDGIINITSNWIEGIDRNFYLKKEDLFSNIIPDELEAHFMINIETTGNSISDPQISNDWNHSELNFSLSPIEFYNSDWNTIVNRGFNTPVLEQLNDFIDWADYNEEIINDFKINLYDEKTLTIKIDFKYGDIFEFPITNDTSYENILKEFVNHIEFDLEATAENMKYIHNNFNNFFTMNQLWMLNPTEYSSTTDEESYYMKLDRVYKRLNENYYIISFIGPYEQFDSKRVLENKTEFLKNGEVVYPKYGD